MVFDWLPIKINVELKADLTNSINILTESSCKGGRKLFTLMLGNKISSVEYHKICAAAQAERNSKLILEGRLVYDLDSGEVRPVHDQLPSFSQYEVFTILERVQELENFAGNLRIALEAVQQFEDEKVADDPVNPDWFARWRREAKVIGNQELQYLWGWVLAEEVKKPQSISFRTLDVLKNLTRKEAETFRNFAHFRLNNALACLDSRSLDSPQAGLSYDDAVTLADAGLIVDTQVFSIDGNRQVGG